MFLSSLFFVCIFLSFGPEVVGFGCSSSGEASASTDIVFEGESYEIKLEFSSLLVDFYKLLNHAERDRTLLVYFTTLASSRTVAFNSELTGCDCLLEEYVFDKQYFGNEQEIQRIYVWPFGFTTVFNQANRAQICILLKRTGRDLFLIGPVSLNEFKKRKLSKSRAMYYSNSTATRRLLLLSGDVEQNPGWESYQPKTQQSVIEQKRSSATNLSIPVRITERMNLHQQWMYFGAQSTVSASILIIVCSYLTTSKTLAFVL